MQNINNSSLITLEEFTKVYKWYEYSLKLGKLINSSINNSIEMEYYFISSDWINEFKKIFNYNYLKRLFENFKQKCNAINKELNNNEILFSYNYFQKDKLSSISNQYKEYIRRINNENILKKDLKIDSKNIIKNYYNNFVILDNEIFQEIKKGYYILECPKKNLYIGDRIFIIPLSNDEVEIGIFESTCQYKEIFILKFNDENEANKEVEKIKKLGIYNYFSSYKINKNDIKSQIINKNDGKTIILYNLKNQKNEINKINEEIKEQNDLKYISNLDISNKRGLQNNNKDSMLNSIIQSLTSIKEINEYLLNPINKDKFLKLNQIYVLTSTLINIINELYDKEKLEKSYNLQKLKIIINFIKPEIISEKTQKSIKELILFLLDTLHEELNKPIDDQNEKKLISFGSKFNKKENSLKEFFDYYNNYYKSIISDNFNWIRQTKNECKECNNLFYSFQSLPFLQFNLDKILDYIITHQTEYKQIMNKYQNNKEKCNQMLLEYKVKRQTHSVSLYNCLDYYSKNVEYKINEIDCDICHKKTKSVLNNFIYRSPNYFIFIIKRKSYISFEFPEEINLETFIEEENCPKEYKLFNILINSGIENNYYSILKNSEEKWIKFDDEKIKEISQKEAHSPYNSEVIIYKGIK